MLAFFRLLDIICADAENHYVNVNIGIKPRWSALWCYPNVQRSELLTLTFADAGVVPKFELGTKKA